MDLREELCELLGEEFEALGEELGKYLEAQEFKYIVARVVEQALKAVHERIGQVLTTDPDFRDHLQTWLTGLSMRPVSDLTWESLGLKPPCSDKDS